MNPVQFERLVDAVARAAEPWRDPDYEPRARAVEESLRAENTFTREAIAFAVNQQMSLLTEDHIGAWISDRFARAPMQVGVLNAGNVPLVGLQDFLAVLLTGHGYLGSVSSKSPALLPAFCNEIRRHVPDLPAEFADANRSFQMSDAIVATGTDETMMWVREQADEHGIPEHRRVLRGHRLGVAVLDGTESDDDFERLAEDALLHEGFGCRNVAIVWAPGGLSPDPFLNALARFRAIFPAHEGTPRRLKMQQAFLEAIDAPHGYGEGLEFLVSKGEPEAQSPGHIRWSEYTDLTEVREWLLDNRDRIQLVVTTKPVSDRMDTDLPVAEPGQCQRPPLAWCPDGVDTVEVLAALR